MQRATTYETGPPLVGCAASGCGAAGTALAMNECSPDMRLSVCLRAVVVGGVVVVVIWHGRAPVAPLWQAPPTSGVYGGRLDRHITLETKA
jgi:hypothetical protein